jgi:hypothetical protein
LYYAQQAPGHILITDVQKVIIAIGSATIRVLKIYGIANVKSITDRYKVCSIHNITEIVHIRQAHIGMIAVPKCSWK